MARDIYRFQPIVASMREFEMIHGTNEHVTFDNLSRLTGFYSRLIAQPSAHVPAAHPSRAASFWSIDTLAVHQDPLRVLLERCVAEHLEDVAPLASVSAGIEAPPRVVRRSGA